MTSPTSPWVDGEPLNAATMYARTTARIDGLGIDDHGSAGYLKLGSVLQQWSSVSVTFSSAATGSAAVTFPIAFSVGPRVFMTVNGNPFYLASTFATPTTTGFTAYIRQIDNTSSSGTVVVQWFAIGLA